VKPLGRVSIGFARMLSARISVARKMIEFGLS
jgi:hypothetical protein